jgi:very-short-patch-repair endonuclease
VVDRLAELATRQHGLVARWQLDELGLSWEAARHRVDHGRLIRVRRGVFLVAGAPRSWPQSVMAAVLGAGAAAWASHRTAARLWRLPVPAIDLIELTTPLERRVRIPGVRGHRSGVWHELDVATASGVPTTSPARTIADLSSAVELERLGRVVDDGLRRGILSLTAMHAVATRFGIAPGRSPSKLHSVLAKRIPGYDPGDSDLETRVFETLRDNHLPLPRRLHRVRVDDRTLTLDLAYPEQSVAIEVDGFDAHRTRTAFDIDRIRQNALMLAGWTVLRFTSRSTDDEIVHTVATALFGHESGR